MKVRVSDDFSDSRIGTLAHRHHVRTFSGIEIVLKDIEAGLVGLGLGKIGQIRLRVSRERFRGAQKHRWLSGRGQDIL